MELFIKILVSLLWLISGYYITCRNIVNKNSPKPNQLFKFYYSKSQKALSEAAKIEVIKFLREITPKLNRLSTRLLVLWLVISLVALKFNLMERLYIPIILLAIMATGVFFFSILNSWVLDHRNVLKQAFKEPIRLIMFIAYSLAIFTIIKVFPENPERLIDENITELMNVGIVEYFMKYKLDFFYFICTMLGLYLFLWFMGLIVFSVASLPIVLISYGSKWLNEVISPEVVGFTMALIFLTSSLYFMW